ncbi:hypothetical protein D3C71_2106230 [compost metagenome]
MIQDARPENRAITECQSGGRVDIVAQSQIEQRHILRHRRTCDGKTTAARVEQGAPHYRIAVGMTPADIEHRLPSQALKCNVTAETRTKR